MTEQNCNKKALTEMDIAQREMALAKDQVRGLREYLETSNLAFSEATSTNLSQGCSSTRRSLIKLRKSTSH